VSTLEKLVKQRNGLFFNLKLKQCPNSKFIYPVTEEVIISFSKSLKGKPTALDDEIPENLFKQCMQLINLYTTDLEFSPCAQSHEFSP